MQLSFFGGVLSMSSSNTGRPPVKGVEGALTLLPHVYHCFLRVY